MERPLVSILIPVYNGSNYLREAIDSALAQTYGNCEILVINDGSDDNGLTEEIALSYGEKLRYFSKPNGGVAEALNFGIKRMRGEYFSGLSHDDVRYPHKVERELSALEKSQAGIVFCSYHIFTDSGRRSLVRLGDHLGKEWLERGILPLMIGLIEFGGCLFHKTLFERYGLFLEELRTTQDYEFLFRVLKHEKSCFIEETLFGIRYHEQQGSRTIASVNEDVDKMYLRFLNEIQDAQRAAAYSSAYNYYYRAYLTILPQGHLAKSRAQCLHKLRELTGQMSEEERRQRNCQAKACLKGCLGQGRKIYIYGCGNYGRRLKKDLEFRGYSVEGFLDGDSKRWGTHVDGSICLPLKELDLNQKEILIIVASIYVDEISQELRKHKGLAFITKKTIDEAGMEFPPVLDHCQLREGQDFWREEYNDAF